MTAELQDLLWKIGAYKGMKDRQGKDLSYEKAVDGISGNLTTLAIEWAKKNGYDVNTTNGVVTKKQSVLSNKSESNKQTLSAFSGPGFLINVANSMGTIGPNHGIPLTQVHRAGLLLGKPEEDNSTMFARVYDNMYPYSYGDILVNRRTGETKSYDGGDVPEGWALRQTSANNDRTVQLQSFYGKVMNGFNGIDPRRKHMNQLMGVDLNSPEGRLQWLKLVLNAPSGMVRITGVPENELFEMRARHDANLYYTHYGTLKYDSWEVNNEYESPTAKARGLKTYRIKDPVQRERIYKEMANWWLANKHKGHWSDDHKSYIVPSMGFMGNHALVSDDEEGTNLRYGDWWDYYMDNVNEKVNDKLKINKTVRFLPGTSSFTMYMGDRIVPEGQKPVRTGNGSWGHNSNEMTEAADDIFNLENILNTIRNN